MYTRFKECLLKPSCISKYVFDNKKKTILYFFIILFIYILPLMVNVLSTREMPDVYSNLLIEKFEESEKINYKLENINDKRILLKTNLNENGQYINLGVSSMTGLNVVLLFDAQEEYNLNDYQFEEELQGKSVIIIHLGYDKLSICEDDIKKVETQKLSKKTWFTVSYDKLGIEELDFSIALYNITTFSEALDQAYSDFYSKNKVVIYLVGIPSIIILGIISLFSQILLIAIIFKLMYRRFNLNYGIFCKMVLCAFTPSVVFNLLSVVYASPFMYLIGEILVVIYITIALKHIVIKTIGDDIEQIIKNQNQGDK